MDDPSQFDSQPSMPAAGVSLLQQKQSSDDDNLMDDPSAESPAAPAASVPAASNDAVLLQRQQNAAADAQAQAAAGEQPFNGDNVPDLGDASAAAKQPVDLSNEFGDNARFMQKVTPLRAQEVGLKAQDTAQAPPALSPSMHDAIKEAVSEALQSQQAQQQAQEDTGADLFQQMEQKMMAMAAMESAQRNDNDENAPDPADVEAIKQMILKDQKADEEAKKVEAIKKEAVNEFLEQKGAAMAQVVQKTAIDAAAKAGAAVAANQLAMQDPMAPRPAAVAMAGAVGQGPTGGAAGASLLQTGMQTSAGASAARVEKAEAGAKIPGMLGALAGTAFAMFAPIRKPAQVEDCVACRYIWLQVEMDVGNSQIEEAIMDSFTQNCIEAQKAPIFYPACQDMYRVAEVMVADYMKGYTVNQMCENSRICR